MNSIDNAVQYEAQAHPGIWNRYYLPFMQTLRAELPYLKLVVLMLLSWLILAQTSRLIIPDYNLNLVDSFSQYFKFVSRNLSPILLVLSIIAAVQIGIFAILKTGAFIRTKRGRNTVTETANTPITSPLLVLNIHTVLRISVTLVIGMCTLTVFMFAYSSIKTRIPDLIPFYWDKAFYDLDKLIFLGKDPWTYFRFVYEAPVVLRTLDLIYDFWALIMISIWVFMLRCGGPHIKHRYQYVLAFMLCWFFGGNISAILFSSAGPCYFEHISTLANPYAEQMAILSAINAETPLRAFEYQDMLWRIYESPSKGLGGISAMPSMHCSTSFLFILAARTKVLKVLASSFFVLILLTSFILAWHYAVDGLLAIPLVYACWYGAGWLLKRLAPDSPKPS